MATDDAHYARRLGVRYPFGSRVVSRGTGYDSASWGGSADRTEAPVATRIAADGGAAGRARRLRWPTAALARRAAAASSGYEKGTHVILDALLLSMCDFVLITVSAVAEFAMWVAPHLWTRHLNLQDTDRFRKQPMPPWTAHVPGATATRRRPAVAGAFCDALAAACAHEATLGKRLYGGKWCSKCKPAPSVPRRRRLAIIAATNTSRDGFWADAPSRLEH